MAVAAMGEAGRAAGVKAEEERVAEARAVEARAVGETAEAARGGGG